MDSSTRSPAPTEDVSTSEDVRQIRYCALCKHKVLCVSFSRIYCQPFADWLNANVYGSESNYEPVRVGQHICDAHLRHDHADRLSDMWERTKWENNVLRENCGIGFTRQPQVKSKSPLRFFVVHASGY